MRIDTHQHLMPPELGEILLKYRIEVPSRPPGLDAEPWSPELAVEANDAMGVTTAVLSLFNPLPEMVPERSDTVGLAADFNDYVAALCASRPDRFGFFATLPMPFIEESAAEAVRALDELHADGIVLLGSSRGTYVGQPGQDELFAELDERSAVVLIHPAAIPGAAVDTIPTFAVDFLLDTTRAAYLIARNDVMRRFPNIRWILSHAGGIVPFAAYRMAHVMEAECGRSHVDTLDDLQSFYFDTALSASPSALPSLMQFARPGHVLFGSDWPLVPVDGNRQFIANLDEYFADDPTTRAAIDTNAAALFPRLFPSEQVD